MRDAFLQSTTGRTLSSSTVKRPLKRMGFRQKRSVGALERDEFRKAAWKVVVSEEVDPQRLVFVDEMGANISLSPLRAWSRRGQRAYLSVPRNCGPNTTLLASMNVEGMGPALAAEGAIAAAVFEVYIEEVLAPKLPPGQVMIMDNLMDNLSAYKGERIRRLVEARGCELLAPAVLLP